MNFDYKKLSEEVFNKNFWPRFFIVILSILLLAINYNLFLLHNNLVIGGTSGLATIVYEIVGLNPAIFIFSFNIVFIIISFILHIYIILYYIYRIIVRYYHTQL